MLVIAELTSFRGVGGATDDAAVEAERRESSEARSEGAVAEVTTEGLRACEVISSGKD